MTPEEFYQELLSHKVAIAQLSMNALTDLPEDAEKAREKALESLSLSTGAIIQCTKMMADMGMNIPADAQELVSGVLDLSDFTEAENEIPE